MGKRKLRLVADELRRETEFEQRKRTMAGQREVEGEGQIPSSFLPFPRYCPLRDSLFGEIVLVMRKQVLVSGIRTFTLVPSPSLSTPSHWPGRMRT